MKNRVLVTGATGFVGSNLVRRLVKEGYEVHILTRKTSNMWRLKDIYSSLIDHKVDLSDKDDLLNAVTKINPNNICHLAIYGGYPSQNEDEKILKTNLNGTINLLSALEGIDYDCFINTGSSSEYGKKEFIMKETDICEPNTVYGIAKLSSTLYCNHISAKENKNIGTIRLFSVYGDYEEKGRLIPTLFINLLNGENVKLGNPAAVRDFVYIDDVVEAYISILKNPEKIKGKIFNISSGNQISIGEISEKVKSILNSSCLLDFGNLSGRTFDSTTWLGDSSLFRETFNWAPKKIDEGLKKSAEWFSKNLNLYKEV